ncbi:MAG: tetratricopeptide repeat protein [Magnetococcales bacterium]|nr:tetratricopeptide repeat protein [Magnetococcales bacterium]
MAKKPTTPTQPPAAPLAHGLEQALLAHQQGRVAEAIRQYQHLLAHHPHHPAALANLASLQAHQGNSAEALALYQKAIQVGAATPELLFNYANLQQKLGMINEAIAQFQAALRLQPTLYPAHYNLGNLLRDQGDPVGALFHYQTALRLQPRLLMARRNLGNLLRQLGRHAEAIQQHRHALALPGQTDQQQAESHYNLANALADAGQSAEAEQQYQAATRLTPDWVAVWLNRIHLYQAQNRPAEARACLAEALTRLPDQCDLLRLHGDALYQQEQAEAALAVYQRIESLQPGLASTANALGVAYRAVGRTDEAEAAWRRCLAIDATHGVALTNLGTLYRLKKRHAEALACLRQAVRQQPDDADSVASLACALIDTGAISEALHTIDPVLARHPHHVDLLGMKAFALVQQARIDEGQHLLAEARRLKPDSWVAIGNTLFSSLYRDTLDAMGQTRLHQELAAQISRQAKPLPPPATHQPARPGRLRRRIGYLSPDFRSHPVGTFIEPVLQHHHTDRFHVTCYALPYAPDATSQRLMASAQQWRDLEGWSLERMATQIQQDGIDILVDLAGYTAGGRPDLLACRPAPVQVNFLGYPYTSGLAGMDYLIADAHLIPPHAEHLYTERVLRLPEGFLCYQRPDAPPVAPLPALTNGFVTFGSFNNTPKLSNACLDLWARVLQAVPQARLALKASSLGDPGTCALFRHHFAERGIAADRILLRPTVPPEQCLPAFGLLDIALDPIPFNGATTSCDTLWMGVPVVTLAGTGYMSRMGTSLLTTLGHPEWIATTSDEYVQIAATLAADLTRLATLRAHLRPQMQASRLCDAAGYTASLEKLYGEMT